MADIMDFPATVEEFMEQYKIVDSKEVYTNGTELVPIYRMKQWFEHVGATDWIPCSSGRLPETEKRVFVTCEHRNIYGKTYPYICKAFHVDRYSMESNPDWDEGCDEYREEDDKFYVLEGWYEVIHNWDDYGSVKIEDTVTAWCEQPEPYKGGVT